MNPDWDNWIERLKSADLTEAELREFEEAVRKDPANRDAYLAALLAETSLEAESLPHPFAKSNPKVIPFPRWPRLAGIAAGVVLLATASYLAGLRLGGKAGPAPVGGHLATITDADRPAEDAGLRIGQPLEKGALKIPDGSEVGIAMRGGARLKVRGPAELQIDGPDKIRLEKGRISTYAPTYAHGFTVDTVDGKVVDLGTRFVTATDAKTGTEVHVLEGLVEARAGAATPFQSLKGENAAVLKGGKLEATEFLAQRLLVPLNPVLEDRDGDGFPDVVESYYGTRSDEAASKPETLRFEESFSGYAAGGIYGVKARAMGAPAGRAWEGAGTFQNEGLSYSMEEKRLRTSGGSVRSTGETGVGALLRTDPMMFPPVGVSYLSFLMQNPEKDAGGCFAGLLLYHGDREELFIGKLSTANSYGSRLKQSDVQDAYGLPLDDKPHLFVVRIDRTRLVTDIFVDPVPGQPESAAKQRFRYQDVPKVDRIVVRSGRAGGLFPSVFDEIRTGLSWESVLPAAE